MGERVEWVQRCHMRRQFLGNKDPDRISLIDVFGVNDQIVFTTPLDEQGKLHRVFVESKPLVTEFLEEALAELPTEQSTGSGRWCNVIPEEALLVLLYDRRGAFERNIDLLTQVLYMDLARVCNLRLSGYSQIGVFQGNIQTYSGIVTLPETVPNGKEEIPTVFVPKIFIS